MRERLPDVSDIHEDGVALGIEPLHEVLDRDKFDRLVQSMEENGWQGPPVVIRQDEDGNKIGITGSHRIAAANIVGIEVPFISVNDEDYVAVADDLYGGIDRLDDSERLDILREVGNTEAARLMEYEIAQNKLEDDKEFKLKTFSHIKASRALISAKNFGSKRVPSD